MFQRFYAEGTEAGLDLDIELEPDKRVYCFIGRNGAGKTVLLENLGRALLLAHAMFERDKASGLRFAGTFTKSGVFGALTDLVFYTPLAVPLR